MKKLHIFRGLPGSGKSTLARSVSPLVVEPDMFRYDDDMEYVFRSTDNRAVIAKTENLLSYAMRYLHMRTLAVTATHTKVAHMLKYIGMAKKYGYAVTVVECYGDYGNVHGVPGDVMCRMAKDFEPMTEEMCAELGVTLVKRYKDGEKQERDDNADRDNG